LEWHLRVGAERLPVQVTLPPAVVQRSAVGARQQRGRLHQLAGGNGEAFVVERRRAAQPLDEVALEFEQRAQPVFERGGRSFRGALGEQEGGLLLHRSSFRAARRLMASGARAVFYKLGARLSPAPPGKTAPPAPA